MELAVLVFILISFVQVLFRSLMKQMPGAAQNTRRPAQPQSRPQSRPAQSSPAQRAKPGLRELAQTLDKQIAQLESTGRALRMPEAAQSLEMQEQPDYVEDTKPVPLASNPPKPQIVGSIQELSSEGVGTEGLGEYHAIYEDTPPAAAKPAKNPFLPDFSKQDLVKSFILSEILKPKYQDEA